MRYTTLLLALALAACGTSTPGSDDVPVGEVGADTPVDVATFDTDADADVDADAALDTPRDAEAGTLDAEPDTTLFGPGDPCQTDDECASDFCVTIDAGDSLAICSDRCVDSGDCPEGSECVRLGGGGADVELVCLTEDFCLDPDEDGHGLGPGCEGDDCDESDPGRYVNAVEVCDGVDNDCDGDVDNGISVVGDLCESGFPGACAEGFYDCDSGLLECRPRTAAAAETCNGLDDDCDGEMDEDEAGGPLARDCYSGPVDTLNVGVCIAGSELCLEADYTSCAGQVVPSVELCNGLDDDCDGETDEGNPGGGDSCSTGVPGLCSVGTRECADGELVCTQTVFPTDEICDGEDNDCDSLRDEDTSADPLSRDCYTGPDGTLGVGTCAGGTQLCDLGAWAACSGEIVPAPDTCDGVNNDCDADGADEGNPGGGLACSTGELGICSAGTTECAGGGPICVPNRTATTETCDGEDQDCDGAADEDSDGSPLTQGCYTGPAASEGVGICRGGSRTCSGGAYGLDCAGEVTPTGEVCNGADEDCDATVDDGCPNGLSLAGSHTSGRYGGGGGSAFSDVCPSGQLVVGVNVRTGGRVDRIQAVCGTISMSTNTSTTPYRYSVATGSGSTLAARGGTGGTAVSYRCPANQMVSGIFGRHASEIDAVGVNCSSLSVAGSVGSFSMTRGSGNSSSQYGGSGGSTFSYTCPGGDIVRGIFGRSASRLDALGVYCGDVSATLR